MKKTPTAKTKRSTPKVEVDKNSSVSIRKIENGYLVSESGYTGKGRNQQWYSKEYFSPNNPVGGITKGSGSIKFGKK